MARPSFSKTPAGRALTTEDAVARGRVLVAELRALLKLTTRRDLGGVGSGNYGHAGRPGEVGGSAPGGQFVMPTGEHETSSELSKAFLSRFDAAFKDSPYKAFVSHYTEDDIATEHMEPLMTNGGKTGLLVHDHGDGRIEATALYNTSDVKGAGLALLKESIEKHGVNYVEAYGGYLPTLYEKLGFETVEKYPFDPSQAAPTWNYQRFDNPDYHMMRLKKDPNQPMPKLNMKADAPINLDAIRKEAEAKLDPAWVKKYGDAAWKAALAVIGEPQ